MAATDSNVRVAVRVRPISRRGKEKNIWYLMHFDHTQNETFSIR